MNLNLKRFFVAALPLAAVLVIAATGCANKKPQAKSSVLDVSPSPVVTSTPAQPQFEPVAPLPPPAAAVTETPAPVKVASTGGSYTVKKGDTLFSIAKAHYGNGNQWQKIASANNGLQPSKLKVGQTITLP